MKIRIHIFRNIEYRSFGFVKSLMYRIPKPCYMLILSLHFFRIVVVIRSRALGLSRVRPSDNLEPI